MDHTHSYALGQTVHLANDMARQTTQLGIEQGQAQWLHLEAGSSLYCSAGEVLINSPWHSALVLAAEDAPHHIGAQAGWYWVQARSVSGAQLQLTSQAYAGWRNARQAVARWLGWCT